MIRVDSREQRGEIKSVADEVRLLAYANEADAAHPFSFDVEVQTKAGQAIRLEIKQAMDFIGSFDKIERQLSRVHGLVIEGWLEKAWILSGRMEDPKFAHLVASAKKRLWRLSLSRAVMHTANVTETVALLRYLESKTEPIALR